MSLPLWILVAIGGAVGSVARFGMGTWVSDRMALWIPGGVMQAPVGTLLINVLGSFLLGAIAMVAINRPMHLTHEMRLLLAVGFCGGFTTFSTFSLEAWTLIEKGHWGEAVLYMGASNVLGLLAVIGGGYTARLAG